MRRFNSPLPLLLVALVGPAVLPAVAQTTLFFNPGENYGTNTTITVANPFTVDIASGTAAHNGLISGDGSLTKTGAGTINLTQANTYSGGTFITGGTLSVAHAGNLGTGDITASGGGDLSATSLEINGPRTLTVTGPGSTLATGYLWFNRDGSADLQTFNVTDGGAVTIDATLSLADLNAASTGNLDVTGEDSSVHAGGIIYIGYTGHSTATVADGGVLSTDAVLSIATLAGSNGTFNLNPGGTLAVGGTNGIAIGAGTGVFNFNGGTIQVTGSNLTTSAAMTLGAAAHSTIDTNSLNAAFSGLLSGDGTLAKTGAGTLTLTADNTHTGGTTVSAGTLQLGAGGTTGSVSGNITNDATVAFNRSDDFYFNGVIGGTGGVTHDGYILRFTQAQTYTGPTLIRGYAFVLPTAVDQGLSAATTVDVGAGAVFDFSNRSLEIAGLSGPGRVYSYGGNSGHLTLNTSAETSFEFSGVLGGDSAYDFALTKTGAGTQILSGANTYTGTTTIDGGTLRATGPGALGATSAITVNNAGTTLAINYGGASDYTEAEATALLAKTTFGATTTALAFDTTNASNPVTYGDALAMNAGFTKLGAGTLVLTGNNTYTGATLISAGTLQIGDGGEEGALPTGTAITNNGTLVFDLSGPTALSDITGSGAVTQQGSGVLTLSGTNTYTGATLISAGTLQIGDGGTTGSLSPDSAIVINGTLAFNRSDLVIQGLDFASSLTGGGQLVQQGGGTLLLLGTNTLGGGAVVNSGTMQLGNGTDAATLQGGAGANGASGVAGDPNVGQDPARNGGAGGDGGGAFVVNSGGTLDLSAQTTIAGGAGGHGGYGWGSTSGSPTQPGSGGNGGAGGNAIVVNGGTLSNLPSPSTVTGGAGGNGGFGGNWSSNSGPPVPPVFAQGGGAGTGGTGVLFLSTSSWTSSGTLIGGAGGNSGEGADFLPGGGGGAGVVFREGGSLDNLGTVSGGVGGLPGLQRSPVAGDIGKQAGYGGAGVAFLANGSLSNSGTISGGLGGNGNLGGGFVGVGPGGDGGLGVAFSAGGSLTNSGVINGGHGGAGGDSAGGGALFGLPSTGHGAIGGTGGSGVTFTASGSLTNSSAISGGNGGDGGDGVFYAGPAETAGSDGGKGGNGGAGVTFTAGGSLTNSGTISGGLGGVGGLGGTRGDPGEDNGADGANGSAGAGVAFAGGAGTFTNQSGGTINGGVSFDHYANTVTLETGSIVNGNLDLNTHAGSTLTLTGSGSTTYSQAVTGVTTFAGSLIKNGSGTWILDQAFTHTGTTTIDEGTLGIIHADALGSIAGVTAIGTGATLAFSGNITVGTETIINNGTLQNASGNNTYAGALSGSGNLTVTAGQLTLSGDNASFQGATTLNGGTLTLGSVNALGTSTVTVNSGATLDLADTSVTIADLDGAGNIALGSATLTTGDSGNHELSGTISGTNGALTKTGAGTLTLSGANTFTGDTTVSAGSLVLGHSLALQNSTVTTTTGLSFGTLTAATLGGLSGSQDLHLENTNEDALALTVGNNHASTTYSGILSGDGSLTKSGTGTLTLTSLAEHEGATHIEAGTFVVSGENTGLRFTSAIVIGNTDSATLTLSEGGIAFSGSTITLGGSATGTGTLNITAAGPVAPNGVALNVLSNGDTIIGHEGTGNVAISGGGVLLSTNDIRLATGANGNAIVTVSGTDGTSDFRSGLGALGSLVIAEGEHATATFTVSDGANAGADNGIEIAAGANSTGTLTVTGSDAIAGTHSQLGAANMLGAETAPPLTIALASGTGSTAHLNILNGGEVILTDSESADALTAGTGTATVTLDDGILSTTTGGTLTSSVAIATSGNNTLNTEDGAIALSGVLSGDGSLTKVGTGTLTLSGANTFSGETALSDGSLVLGHSLALQNSTLTTATGLDFGTLTAATLGGLSGFQDLHLENTNSTALALTVGNNDSSTAYSGILSGSGSLTKSGTGTLTLSGIAPNTYEGGTAINGGAFAISADSALGDTNGDLSFDGGTLVATNSFTLGSERTITLHSSGGTLEAAHLSALTVAGEITGSGNLGLDGEGIITLARDNSFTGNTTLLDGDLTLTLGHTNALQYSTVTTTGGLRFGHLTAVTLGGLAGTQDLALTNTALDPLTLTVGNNGPTTTHSGVISGNGSLVLTGGTLTLAGANTFTGTTTISNGTLVIGHADALQNSTLTPDGGTLSFGSLENANVRHLAGSGTITLASTSPNPFSLSVGGDGAYDSTFNGSFEGSGNLIKTGTGTLTLNGSNSNFTGTATLAGGTLALGNSSALENATLHTVAGGGTIDFGFTSNLTLGGLAGDGDLALPGLFTLEVGHNSPTTTYSGNLSGDGILRLTGGQLTLAGANAFSGTAELQSGTLILDHSLALQSATLQHDNSGELRFGDITTATLGGLDGSNSIALANASSAAVALTLDVASGFEPPDYRGTLSGPGSLIKTGAGTQILSSQNTFTGETTVSAGTLRLTHENALQNSTLVTTATGTVDVSVLTSLNLGGLSGNGDLASGPSGLSLNIGSNNTETTYSGVLSGNVDLTKSGSSTLILAGANTFSGDIYVENGALALDHALAAQNAVISLSGGGELRFKSTSAATLGGLSGSRDIYLSNENYAAVTLTLDVSPGSGEDNPDFSGVLYDAGSVTKTGSGTQILSGNNTYSGGTTVNAGTLVLSGANTFTGDTTVTGGTLRLTHADALQNSTLVTSSSGGFIDFSELSSLNLGGLSGNGNLSAGFSELALNVGANHADTTYSGILANGGASRLSLTKSGSGTLTLANANPFSGDTTISAGTIQLAHAQALQNSVVTTAAGLSFGTLEAATLGGLSGSGTLALTNSAETPAAVALTLNVGSGAFGEDPTFSGSLTGTGSLTKTGSGTQVLAAANPFTGTTTVSAGILRLTHADALQNSTLVTTATGTVDLNSLSSLNLGGLAGNGALNAPFTSLALNVGANHDDTTYSGTLSGAISLTKSGTGTLTLSGANSYSNSDPFFGTTTTIEAGTLAYATRAAFYNGATRANPAVFTGATAAFHVGGPGYFSDADIGAIMSDDNFRTGATLELNTSNATDGAFTLATTLVDGDAGDNILHLTKSGAGTLTLAGTNTYTGATNISGGTLHLTGSAVNSAFTVNSGGTLTGAGATGDLTIAAGATFSPGSSPGLFTVNGDLSLLGTTLMELAADGTRGIAYDAITVTDTITFGGTLTVSLLGDFDPTIGMSFNLFDWTGPSSGVFGTLDLPNLTAGLSWDDTALYTTGTLSITTSAIPEPSTYAALFGACVLGFAAWHKRRRSTPA